MSEVQLVVFKLDREEYGVNIMQVQEIGEYKQPTKVPNAPDFIEGIINLRGDIIPIVDLHKRFNIPKCDITELTSLIVMNAGGRRVAFVVDDAPEVLTISDNDIEEAPSMIVGSDRRYISGVGKVGDRILIVLDLDKLFSEEETEKIQAFEA